MMTLPYFKDIRKFLRNYVRSVQLDTDRSFVFEMVSPEEVKMCGVLDVKNYDEGNVLVVSEGVITEIKGNNLIISRFTDSEISVGGEILQINFIRR